MARQEGDILNLREGVRNHHVAPIVIYADDGDDLIIGAFHVELNLGMLIGNAQSFDGGLPYVDSLAVAVFTAQGLRPQLRIPIGEVFELSLIHISLFLLNRGDYMGLHILSGSSKGIGLRLAPPFGDGLGKVCEQNRKPEDDDDG